MRSDWLGWATNMLPWFGQELEDTKALMGKNFYSYGVDPNRKAVCTKNLNPNVVVVKSAKDRM